jgi:phosphatidylinositol glycan class N
LQRIDVEQADIAPLMSTLIGIPFPMNSVGTIPLKYLQNSEKYKSLAAFGNAKQVLAQFIVKEASKRKTELYFQPFKALENYQAMLDSIKESIEKNLFEKAESDSLKLVKICLEGLNYYQKYDWLFLRSVISMGYLGWIVLSLCFILEKYVKMPEKPKRGRPKSSTNPSTGGWTLNMASFTLMISISQDYEFSDYYEIISRVLMYTFGLEVLVYSYFQREILTLCLIVAAFVWPLSFEVPFRQKNWSLVLYWSISCLFTSVFTVLPVEKGQDMRLVYLF